MPNSHNLAAYFVLFLLMGAFVLRPDAAYAELPIKPHSAVYEIDLLEAKSSANVVSVKGEMHFDLTYDCEGWATRYDFDMEYHFVGQPAARIKTSTTTYEQLDEPRYDFSMTRKMAGQLIDEISGRAIREDDALNVKYTKAEEVEKQYDVNVMLPTEHTLAVINQAKSGKRFSSYDVFDGLDENGVMKVTTIIGSYDKDSEKYNKGPVIAQLISDHNAWRLNMGYFGTLEPKDVSDYEISATLYESGVLDDVRMDYHEYVVGQELTTLTMHDMPKCAE